MTKSIPVHDSLDVPMIHCDVHLHLNYIHCYAQSPRIHVNARWVCVCARSFAVGSAGAGCGSDSIRLNIQQAKFAHKKHSVSWSVTHSARQSQIVADKINTASRYE